jgi:peptide/nickel transport system permease protein
VLPYVLRRLVIGILTLWVASFLVFLLVSLSGDPLALLRANPHIPPKVIAQREAILHLHEPVIQRYWTWFTHILRGDFGNSISGAAVRPVLGNRLLVTMRMVIPSLVLGVILALATGVISAVRQYSTLDYTATFASFLFFATPVFVIGILLKEFLAIHLNQAVGQTIVYTLGQQSAPLPTDFYHRLLDYIAHSALPVITLTVGSYAAWSRYMRSQMLEVMNSDYIRLARAKGLSPWRVLTRHTMRNALVPFVTVVALDTAAVFGGAVITEEVFGWQGMGQYLLEGLTNIDVNVVLAFLVVTASLVIAFNIIADILYAYLDPRIRLA